MSADGTDPSRSGRRLLGVLFAATALSLFLHPTVIAAAVLVGVVVVTIIISVFDRDGLAAGGPAPLEHPRTSGGERDVQDLFLARLRGAARVGDEIGAGVNGQLPDGPRVEVRFHADRLDLRVPLPEGASASFDLSSAGAIPQDLVRAPRSAFDRGLLGALTFLFQTWRARRVWTEDGHLNLAIRVDPTTITASWVARLLELTGTLLLVLDEVPGLLAGVFPAEAFALAGPPSARAGASAAAATLVGRAVASRLDASRVERQGIDEVVSGRIGEQGVTLRLRPGGAAQLSFGIPWRAGFDFDAAGLPAEVRARLEQGGGREGLSDSEAALVDLFGVLGCVRLHAHARRAHATLRRDQRLLPSAWADLVLGIPARLADLARSPVVMIGRRAPDPEAGPTTCPYCKDAADGVDVMPCGSCGTVHHTECFGEAGGCTVLGCAAAPRRSGNPPVMT